MADQAPPTIEYQRGPTDAGPGEATPLPYGGATQVNEQVTAPPVEDFTPTEADIAAAIPPPPEGGAAPEETFRPGMGTTGLDPEDEKFLFGQTEYPDQVPTPLRMIDPQEAAAWLPALRAEATRPDAPAQLKAIFKALTLGPGA